MKIYTKRGDAGKTELFGGVRVSKTDLRIRVYGEFDELNATLGVVLAEPDLPVAVRERLLRVQSELFRLGAELAAPAGKKLLSEPMQGADITRLEAEIDQMETALPPLKNFILPGGTRAAALLHLARTTCRRGERDLAVLHESQPVRPEILQYVNRMSDYLFVLARTVNHQRGIADIPWSS